MSGQRGGMHLIQLPKVGAPVPPDRSQVCPPMCGKEGGSTPAQQPKITLPQGQGGNGEGAGGGISMPGFVSDLAAKIGVSETTLLIGAAAATYFLFMRKR